VALRQALFLFDVTERADPRVEVSTQGDLNKRAHWPAR
jgi:hypothetical protein